MPARTFGGVVGIEAQPWALYDDWPDDALEGRSVGYRGTYRPGDADQPSTRLVAYAHPDWWAVAGRELPSTTAGAAGLTFGGPDRQHIATTQALVAGDWSITLSASNGSSTSDPFYLRWFVDPTGACYAVRVDGAGSGAGSIALVSLGADGTEEVLDGGGSIANLTTETTLTVSRAVDGSQSLAVDGTTVASADDNSLTRPTQLGLDYRGGDARTYDIHELTLS